MTSLTSMISSSCVYSVGMFRIITVVKGPSVWYFSAKLLSRWFLFDLPGCDILDEEDRTPQQTLLVPYKIGRAHV